MPANNHGGLRFITGAQDSVYYTSVDSAHLTAKNMNDYIDIGILGNGANNKQGRWETQPLYLKQYKLSAGLHTITVIVKGKPISAGIDPFAKLIDREPNDNMKGF